MVLAFLEIDIEKLMVGEQPARSDAEHVPPLRQVVEVRDPVGKFDRVVERKQVRARAELDVPCSHERLRDEQVRRGNRLPWRGEVLANPRLAEAQRIRQLQTVQVPLVRVPCRALRRV